MRRGVFALFAAVVLSLAVLGYWAYMHSLEVRLSYHGEAEWMILLATARHSLATGISLDTLMARLGSEARDRGIWIPPVQWSVSYASWGGNVSGGWLYRAVFYNASLGWRGLFVAGANYTLVSGEKDWLGNRWLIYNLTYLHKYKIPQYNYSITVYPSLLNSSCASVLRSNNAWTVRALPGCVVRDVWGIAVLEVP